jgi:hypothetical protein
MRYRHDVAVQLIVRRADVRVGRYAYRVLRPARPLRGAVLAQGPELLVPRRDGIRMLALASLATERILVDLPLRDASGRPVDLVVADEELRFPAERWSDVRQRLGVGRLERHTPAPDGYHPVSHPKRAAPGAQATRHALVISCSPTDLKRLREGDTDLGFLRVHVLQPRPVTPAVDGADRSPRHPA